MLESHCSCPHRLCWASATLAGALSRTPLPVLLEFCLARGAVSWCIPKVRTCQVLRNPLLWLISLLLGLSVFQVETMSAFPHYCGLSPGPTMSLIRIYISLCPFPLLYPFSLFLSLPPCSPFTPPLLSLPSLNYHDFMSSSVQNKINLALVELIYQKGRQTLINCLSQAPNRGLGPGTQPRHVP